jgi:hypothetical protein
VPRVLIAPGAIEDLTALIRSHSLPSDTRTRFRRSVSLLERFPLLGPALGGRWDGYRYILGPWRWMIVVYQYDERADEVSIVAVQDARSSRAVTSLT